MKFKWQLFILMFISWIFGFIAGYFEAFLIIISWIVMFVVFLKLFDNDKMVKDIYEDK